MPVGLSENTPDFGVFLLVNIEMETRSEEDDD